MNNNQDFSNTQTPNVNSIPVIPPVPMQPVNTNTAENNQNINPLVENVPQVEENTNKFINVPTNMQNSQNIINELNIGDNTSNQTPQEAQNYNETSIADLNVDGKYNRMEKAPEYVNSPEVRENINPTKKNTVTITKELKTVLIITGIILVFIIIMPVLFELLSKIRFH